MSEIELKFQIPTAQTKALTKAILQLKPTLLSLVAHYYDTPELELAQANISLRQRLENQVWKQTLKAPSSQAATRIEINIALKQAPESLDLKLYQQHPQAQALLKPILHRQKSLVRQLSTEVQRQILEQQQPNSTIEIALDQGWLITKDKKVKISEIEFELKSGPITELIEAIRPWMQKYSLYLDTQSKAERGYALLDADQQPATYQSSFRLQKKQSTEQALRRMVNHCLQHLLPNASAIARNDYHAEHVHQVRVAIRRLRSAFKTFQHWTTTDLVPWQQQLRQIFQQLGTTRDQDALNESLIPLLQQAGSPLDQLPQIPTKSVNLSHLFRESTTTLLWLDLIAFSQSQVAQPPTSLQTQVNQRIGKLHHKVVAQQHVFMDLSIEEKHQLRKKVKQLRYSLELTRGVLKPKVVKAYLKALKPLQEVLGEFNDLSVAETLIVPALQQEPRYWFMLGWIRAQQMHVLTQADLALKRFAQQAKL